MNQTTDSLEVECLPGFNGGMDQDFVLEVADLHSKAVLANATDKQPEFTVSILQALKPLYIQPYSIDNAGIIFQRL